MKAFPAEYRHRVVALTGEGYTSGEIAEVLGARSAWVRSIKAWHAPGRPLEPKSCANTRGSLAEREGERIRAQIRAKPGTTLEDLERDLALGVSVSNLWYALQDLKITLKKAIRAAEQHRPDVAAARAEWKVAAAGLDPRRLVFLDETFGTTAMTRRCGWGPSHERVDYAAPFGHWKTTTFVAASAGSSPRWSSTAPSTSRCP